MQEPTDQQNPTDSQAPQPFLYPCKKLAFVAPISWVKLAWQDMCQAPIPSLSIGISLMLASYMMAYLAFSFGGLVFLIALLSGFIFLGPILAMAFYEISVQLQRGQAPKLSDVLHKSLAHLSDQMIFALMLLIIFLIWARASSLVHVFFPSQAQGDLKSFVLFLGIGTVVGSLFSMIIFCISAFSLPMIVDRNVDAITAVITSVNAVLRNLPAMFLWVLIIVGFVALGVASGFLGLGVLLPLLGHATWHGYQETIQ